MRFAISFVVCIASVFGMNLASALGSNFVAIGLAVIAFIGLGCMGRIAWKSRGKETLY